MNFIKKMVYNPVIVYDNLIPFRENTRPGINMVDLRGLCIHHTALVDVDWYNLYISIQRENHIKVSSYNDVMALNGDIHRFIPMDEISYTSGSYKYSDLGKNYYDSQAWKYTHDMEVCIYKNYNMIIIQEENIAKWAGYHCLISGLKVDDHYHRHLDIALDKPQCPEWLKGNRWKKSLSMANRFYDICAEEAEMKRVCSVLTHPASWNNYINKC